MMQMMSQQPQPQMPLTEHSFATSETREAIASRFGEVVIDRRNALFFPRGMLGMPQFQRFALAEFPSGQMHQFKLLQSLEDTQLSFIVLPVAMDNQFVGTPDIRTACRELGVGEENLVLLLVVCVHREMNATRLSVNARAPIFLDSQHKTGAQYVFPQDHYKVQHYIS